MMFRRSAVVGTTLAVALGVFAPAISANEIDDLLMTTREATFNATRITKSVWGDQIQIADQWVEHWSGGEIVRTNSTWSVYGNGRSITMGDTPEGLAFVTPHSTPDVDRYTVGEVTNITHMGRSCSRIEIMEGDHQRATLIVDERSGAVLYSETYNLEGRIFRTTALSDFKPYRVYSEPEDMTSVPMQVIMHSDSDVLPDELAGYEMVDVFPGPGGSEQGFYSDGLFGFSLFSISKRTPIEGFEDAAIFVTPNGTYDMIPTAQDVRLRWKDKHRSFVLVGDVPPDHVSAILDELPEPHERGMFSGLWHKLFG